jgi:hypothetical protein
MTFTAAAYLVVKIARDFRDLQKSDIAQLAARIAHATSTYMRFVAVVGALGLAAMACEKPMDSQEAAATTDNALSATAQCVRQASDAELIAELQARLAGSSSGSSGATSGDTSACSFSCDSSTNFRVSVIGPTGAEKTASVFVGNPNTCGTYADKLSQTRASISHLSLIAVCDSSTNLHRFSITPAGALSELAVQFTGNPNTCASQADAINR